VNQGRTVFSQLLGFLPDREFRRCVARYGGDARPRGFSCWDQYLAMAFAQLTYREGLRDIEACLRSLGGKLYHMGFHGRVSRSTLADANDAHDWRIYAEFAQVLIRIARPLYASDPIGVDLDQSLYALDSTTIDLCLAFFPWAHFRSTKSAVKMHTLLDLHGNIPAFIHISDGKLHDVHALDRIAIEPGAYYAMDRGYLDFERLYRFTLGSAFFVTRSKKNVLLQRRYSHPVDKSTGVISDQTVILSGGVRTPSDALVGRTLSPSLQPPWIDANRLASRFEATAENHRILDAGGDPLPDLRAHFSPPRMRETFFTRNRCAAASAKAAFLRSSSLRTSS